MQYYTVYIFIVFAKIHNFYVRWKLFLKFLSAVLSCSYSSIFVVCQMRVSLVCYSSDGLPTTWTFCTGSWLALSSLASWGMPAVCSIFSFDVDFIVPVMMRSAWFWTRDVTWSSSIMSLIHTPGVVLQSLSRHFLESSDCTPLCSGQFSHYVKLSFGFCPFTLDLLLSYQILSLVRCCSKICLLDFVLELSMWYVAVVAYSSEHQSINSSAYNAALIPMMRSLMKSMNTVGDCSLGHSLTQKHFLVIVQQPLPLLYDCECMTLCTGTCCR